VTWCDCWEALLDRLAQTLEDVAGSSGSSPSMGICPPPDQLHIRDRVVGGGKGTGRAEGGAVAGRSGDAMDECGFDLDCMHVCGSKASAAHNALES
jgi:hypothetical protein